MQHFLKDLTIMLSGMVFHAADTHRATSEGAARKGAVEGKVRIRTANYLFFRLRNRQKVVRIRFEIIRYLKRRISLYLIPHQAVKYEEVEVGL